MTKSILTKKILYWYDNNKRSLPWRKKLSQVKREYYTLVSEFMLQQTQVATVIPYFNNFVKDIPDIKSLDIETNGRGETITTDTCSRARKTKRLLINNIKQTVKKISNKNIQITEMDC